MEKRQLQDLEARKELLDKDIGAKLTELGNRQRRDELEQKSRQLMYEREQLNASFEAAKQRTAVLEQTPPPTSDRIPGYEDSEGSDTENVRNKQLPNGKLPSKTSQVLTNGYVDDVDWSESSDEARQGSYSPAMAMMLASGVAGSQVPGTSDPLGETPVLKSVTSTSMAAPPSAPMKNGIVSPQVTYSNFQYSRIQVMKIGSLAIANGILKDLRTALRALKAEETIEQLRGELDLFKTSGNEKHAQLSSKLENENLAKNRMESEISSLKIRLENANNELDKANTARQVSERQMHELREELYTTKLQLEKEVSSLREANQSLTSKLQTAEGKVNSLEQEERQVLADKNENLTETIHRLKDESAKLNEKIIRHEEELKQINQ
ncbi:predicted protein, partial [Nematostella vectensis]